MQASPRRGNRYGQRWRPITTHRSRRDAIDSGEPERGSRIGHRRIKRACRVSADHGTESGVPGGIAVQDGRRSPLIGKVRRGQGCRRAYGRASFGIDGELRDSV